MTHSTFYNRVMFQAVAGGTGNFIVNTAISGYSTPAQRGVTDGATVSYTAESLDKTQWEVGTGVYTAASTTVARTTIRESSNANLIVNFSASPIVFLDYQAQDIDTVPDWVNVWDFGADPSSADNTAAIQAAIDYAFVNNIATVYVPSGNYSCDDQIFLDYPGNLRSSFTVPTIFNFSMALIGDPGLPNHEGKGSIITFTRSDDVMLVVGTGQGMTVRDLNVFGPAVFTRGSQDPNGVGVGLCGGSGGSTRARIENVLVENFYSAFKTGANGVDALCDSNTFIKCWAYNCYYGFWYSQTQNFISTLIDCQPGCTIGVYNPNGCDVKVVGGNYSSSGVVGAYAISATSVLTAAATGNSYNYTFTTTITNPDYFWGQDPGASGPLINSVSFETANFGIVPGVVTGYVPATHVATIQIYPMWGYTQFGGVNAKTNTDLEANLQACVIAFFAERVTTFQGNNMTIDGIHVENPDTPTTLINAMVGFGSNRPVSLKNLFCNFDPCNVAVAHHATPSIRARYMLAAAHFPFFTNASSGSETTQSDIHLMDVTLTAGTELLVDVVGTSSFKIDGARGTYFNMRAGSDGKKINVYALEPPYYASGSFVDEGHFNAFTTSDLWRKNRGGFAPWWGWRPAPYTTPCVAAGDMAVLSGALPAILSTTNTCSYPLLWGGQVYKENSFTTTEPIQFWSNHNYYSYGQDLTNVNVPGQSWTYRGQSNCVYVNDTNFIFPGLGVILNDGASDIEYIVTGVYRYDGYFTVARNGGTGLLSGVKTVDITGATIKQSPYAITQVADSVGGSTLQVQYNNAGGFGGMAGTSWDNTNRSLTITGATVTASKPVLDLSQTWNNVAVAFTGYKFNVTNSNSLTTSRILDIQLGGVSGFYVAPLTAAPTIPVVIIPNGFQCNGNIGTIDRGVAFGYLGAVADLSFGSDVAIDWCSTTNPIGTVDTSLNRRGPGVLGVGTNSTANASGFFHTGGMTRIANDFSKTSDASLANVTGLTVTVTAGRTYSFTADLPFTCAAAGGVQASIAGTATATDIRYNGYIIDSGANGIKGNVQASALGTAVATSVTTGTDGLIRITGTITVNAAGTLTVQFAQNTSNVTASIAKRGGFFMVNDMP